MLARYFPVDELPPKQPPSEAPEDEIEERLRTVQGRAASFAVHEIMEEEGLKKNRQYSYRSEVDLPPTGRDFFRLAGRLSGLSVSMLLRAVNMLEANILVWQREQRRGASERRERSRSAMSVELDGGLPTPDE